MQQTYPKKEVDETQGIGVYEEYVKPFCAER
jgi:hypothetical protein